MNQVVILYLFDGLSDWEASYVLPELRKAGFTVKTAADSKAAVETMGGLKVIPDLTLPELESQRPALLILPGGTAWDEPTQNADIVQLVPRLLEQQVKIGAICGAVTVLARLGVLDDINHTSNHLALLKALAPAYKGEHLHSNRLAESDGNIITASGIGAMEFAHKILLALDVYDEEKANQWLDFFKNGVFVEWIASG